MAITSKRKDWEFVAVWRRTGERTTIATTDRRFPIVEAAAERERKRLADRYSETHDVVKQEKVVSDAAG